MQTISALEALRWWVAKVCLLNGATQPILASILLREGLCMCCEVRKNCCELRKPPILVAHRLADTLLLFVAPWPAIGGSVGNLSPSLFLNPTALSHHVGGPVRAIAVPHTATQVMWESRGLRPAVTYHILLPFRGQKKPGGK